LGLAYSLTVGATRRIRNPARVAAFLIAAVLSPAAAGAQTSVAALGFVEPEGGVVRLSGAVSADSAAVSVLYVREGDRVTAGQIIAVLHNHDRLDAAQRRAEAQVGVAQARLNLAKAGASEGAIGARKAVVDRLTIQVENAAQECERANVLIQKQTLSESVRDQRCLEEQVLLRQLIEANAALKDVVEVRDVDVAVTEAELKDAEAALGQAKADYQRSLVRAPTNGQILKVHTQAGEAIGPRGIVELGQTDRMWVSAEVYETDISRVRVGQSAIVTSDGFSRELQGTVASIGLMVAKNEIIDADPAADVDARVVEVKIRLDEAASKAVEQLTNLQMRVVIKAVGGP
jgi:HlyD family secretion protein